MRGFVDTLKPSFRRLFNPMSIKQNGVDAAAFESKVDLMAERAFEDQCTTANPKLPLVSELAEIYRSAYKGV
ncbi:hypothetical protein DT075_05135 [Bacillus licheniformis]|nr:hypothetical protein DT075_05135 [Bacillus licheniformis]